MVGVFLVVHSLNRTNLRVSQRLANLEITRPGDEFGHAQDALRT